MPRSCRPPPSSPRVRTRRQPGPPHFLLVLYKTGSACWQARENRHGGVWVLLIEDLQGVDPKTPSPNFVPQCQPCRECKCNPCLDSSGEGGAAGCLEAGQGEPEVIPPWFRLPQGTDPPAGEALPGDQRRSACCRSVTPLAACHRASSAPPPRSSTIQTLLPSGIRRSLRRVVSFSFPRCNRDSAGPPWPGSSVACPAGAVCL